MTPRPPKVTTLDFETRGIMNRPLYPPVPVGFSVKRPGEKKSKYYAWGHPCENNCTKEEAIKVLESIWPELGGGSTPLLCQNAKFDYDVAVTHMGMPEVSWELLHDTLYLLFLDNPHAASHSLKPSAERILSMKPEEQDAVKDWLMEHQDELRCNGLLALDVKLSISTSAKKSASGQPQYWAAYICLAPGKLVGAYADGDVVRTEALFKKLWPSICDRGMRPAYDRERELMPILLKNEGEGVRFDTARAATDSLLLATSLEAADAWLRKTLKDKGLNIDSDADLAQALISAGKADEGLFARTAKSGKLSTAKDSLIGAVTDRKVLATLQYRSKISTFLGTFIKPWLDQAQQSGCGLVYPNWNQVKQYGSSGDAGARTGRMSASRFMNTPKEVPDGSAPAHLKGAAPIPFVRSYLMPDKGELWGKRDYSQQEFRILAHYEDGNLLEKFGDNPDVDVHFLVASIINHKDTADVTKEERGIAKTIGFGLLYGMGLGKLAEKLGLQVDEAKKLKKEYMGILPGLKDLQDQLSNLAKADQPLRTWGGREYYVEEPKYDKGYKQTFEYKLLNYLIQGSAADCTKQAIINYDKVRIDGRFLITVHDEINFSCPKKAMAGEMALLRESMLDVDFDVPMLSDGKTGVNWGDLVTFKEK